MLNISRLVALALAFSFVQIPLGGASAHCASHDSADSASTMEHMATASTDGHAQQMRPADDAGCDDCTAPEDSQPCDHTTALGCISMASCTAAFAELISASPTPNVAALLVVDTHVLTPSSPSLSQDTPPPRA